MPRSGPIRAVLVLCGGARLIPLWALLIYLQSTFTAPLIIPISGAGFYSATYPSTIAAASSVL